MPAPFARSGALRPLLECDNMGKNGICEVSYMWKQLNTLGTIGCEKGKILTDEEYEESCRITLEKCERYYAITCGIYGNIMHTAFTDEVNCWGIYNAMKRDLQKFIDNTEYMSDNEKMDFYDKFTSEY